MSTQVTATGKAGPGLTVTAAVFTNVATFSINNYNAKMLVLTFTDGRPVMYLSITAATTMTVTISGANFTVTIS